MAVEPDRMPVPNRPRHPGVSYPIPRPGEMPPTVPTFTMHSDGLRIVALGGGTGLAVLLRGLRELCFTAADVSVPDHERLTAIVSVADDGGNSGALRRTFHILAPGDIRNCLLALSEAEPLLQTLFDYRFSAELDGHQLGNLMLTALTLRQRNFVLAVEEISRLLRVRGRVLPATADDVQLAAEFTDGRRVLGESRITAAHARIHRVSLRPAAARALPEALRAIARADLIVLGPGSLYTSVIPVLLVRDLVRAIVASRAPVLLIANLMREPGETDGYGVGDCVRALQQHAAALRIDAVLVNQGPINRSVQQRYAEQGAVVMPAQRTELRALGCRIVEGDLAASGLQVRHDPHKLAQALLGLLHAQAAA